MEAGTHSSYLHWWFGGMSERVVCAFAFLVLLPFDLTDALFP